MLAAARAFAEYGYVEAKVDRIAERAELTRCGPLQLHRQARRVPRRAGLKTPERARDSAEPPTESPESCGARSAVRRVSLDDCL